MIRIVSLLIFTCAIGLIWSFSKPAAAPINPAFPEKLPGAYTGGFEEESCHSCHFDYPINPDRGSFKVEGIPNQYEAEKSYEITISVSRKELGKAGFQISSRFDDGKQAGSFKADSKRLRFTEVKQNIQYLQHSMEGSKVQNRDSTAWNFYWTAPAVTGSSKIIFNLAANAGNGDASAFGDYIFTKEISISPSTEK